MTVTVQVIKRVWMLVLKKFHFSRKLELKPGAHSCVAFKTLRICIVQNIIGSYRVCRKVQVVQSLFLPFPLSVYPWQDLDHTIKPRHWTRPFTPHFRPSDRGKFLVETVIFAW